MKFTASSLVAREGSLQEADHTTAITVASWTMMFIVVVVFVARQIMKAVAFRGLAIDDGFAFAAAACAIGLSITAIVLGSLGSGSQGPLASERANAFMKGYYASEMLYISATCFAKLSLIVIFYSGFERLRLHRHFVTCFGCFILAWSIASTLTVAVQCALPRPWGVLGSQCFDTWKFWVVYCTIDTITELLIVATSVIFVAHLDLSTMRKVLIITCFAPRALVVCAAILRLTWLHPSTSHGQPQFRLWLPTIVTQVQICLNIITAFVPYMVPFFHFPEGNVSRSNSVRGQKVNPYESQGRIGSSLWFRRHKPRGARDSWNSHDAGNDGYKHIPHASPYLATPEPTSPMTSPAVRLPPIRSSSKNGLCISIPLAQRMPEYDMLTSRTASSFTLSPTCASPQPLLAPRKAPSPPPKAYTPGLTSADFRSTPSMAAQRGTPRAGHFSLFPSQRAGSRSPQPRPNIMASPPIASVCSTRLPALAGGVNNPSPHLLAPSLPTHPTPPPKFSTTPRPASPPPTTLPLPTLVGPQLRPESVQDLNSPMGAALNSFFGDSGDASPGGFVRNQQYLAPFTPIRESATGLPVSRTSIQDELFLPASISREEGVHVVKDVRSKASVVVPGSL